MSGIDINSFELNGMELTWFDFGGQEVFYSTHQFFLTSQCVYLVVFRVDDPDYMSRVQYWLQNIRNFAKDPSRPAKVIVVGTHTDMLANEDSVESIWKDLEPHLFGNGNVIGWVAVSCKTGKGLEQLIQGIEKAIEVGNLGLCDVPKYYTEIALWIKNNRNTCQKLSWNEMREFFPQLSEIQLSGGYKFLKDEHVNKLTN